MAEEKLGAQNLDADDSMAVGQEEPRRRFMTFRSSNEIYGISLDNVHEIIGLQQYTSVPETEDYIMGLINLRGKVIPIIDVRIRFGKKPLAYNDRTCVIVIQVKDTVIGLIVDGIEGVVDIHEKEILPPPSISSLKAQAQKYVFGIGKVNSEVKLLLDPEKLIYDVEDEKVSEEEEED